MTNNENAGKEKAKPNTDMIAYYSDRANEYEKIYEKPDRLPDLENAALILQDVFMGLKILEISCGTGYWTEIISKTASSIFATDINETMLEIAKYKKYDKANVSFGIADFYLYKSPQKFAGLFGGFIWSHIQLQDLDAFLENVRGFLLPGATVAFIDSNYVEGSNHPISSIDENGNTFQLRKLEDGSEHLVRKNFPDEKFILSKLQNNAENIRFYNLKHFWIIVYQVTSCQE